MPFNPIPGYLQPTFDTLSRLGGGTKPASTHPDFGHLGFAPKTSISFPQEGEIAKVKYPDGPPVFPGDPNQLQIYMGTHVIKHPMPGQLQVPASEREYTTERVPYYLSVGDAKAEFDQWDDKRRNKFVNNLKNLGVIQQTDGAVEARAWWEKFVQESAQGAQRGRTAYGPWEAMKTYGDPNKARRGMYTTTSFDFQQQTSSPLAAKAFINQALSSALGRDATDGEVAKLTKALNADERKHPLTRKTTTVHSGGMPGEDREVTSSSQTTGGFSDVERQQMLLDKAKQSDEYGAYQAVATYFPALLSALAGPVTG